MCVWKSHIQSENHNIPIANNLMELMYMSMIAEAQN